MMTGPNSSDQPNTVTAARAIPPLLPPGSEWKDAKNEIRTLASDADVLAYRGYTVNLVGCPIHSGRLCMV